MEWLNSFLTMLAGFALRLAIPITVTALAAHFLRKLDAHWQAQFECSHRPQNLPRIECWQIKGCTAEERAKCPVFASSIPCWQVFRQQDGRLKEECLRCKVFLGSPPLPKA